MLYKRKWVQLDLCPDILSVNPQQVLRREGSAFNPQSRQQITNGKSSHSFQDLNLQSPPGPLVNDMNSIGLNNLHFVPLDETPFSRNFSGAVNLWLWRSSAANNTLRTHLCCYRPRRLNAQGDWWIAQVSGLNIHLRCKRSSRIQKRDVGFLYPRWSRPRASFYFGISVSSVKYFKISVSSCCETETSLKTWTNSQNGKAISSPALFVAVSCVSRYKCGRGSELTSSRSGYIQTSATVQGHSYSFFSSNSTWPWSSLQIRRQFHHILPVRASIAQAEQPSSHLYCYQTRVFDDQNSADAVCRGGMNQNSLGGSLSSELGFAGRAGVKASFEKASFDLANTEASGSSPSPPSVRPSTGAQSFPCVFLPAWIHSAIHCRSSAPRHGLDLRP